MDNEFSGELINKREGSLKERVLNFEFQSSFSWRKLMLSMKKCERMQV